MKPKDKIFDLLYLKKKRNNLKRNIKDNMLRIMLKIRLNDLFKNTIGRPIYSCFSDISKNLKPPNERIVSLSVTNVQQP